MATAAFFRTRIVTSIYQVIFFPFHDQKSYYITSRKLDRYRLYLNFENHINSKGHKLVAQEASNYIGNNIK